MHQETRRSIGDAPPVLSENELVFELADQRADVGRHTKMTVRRGSRVSSVDNT
jgi:hypothetical protein